MVMAYGFSSNGHIKFLNDCEHRTLSTTNCYERDIVALLKVNQGQ
jgi:hypothetical protein